METTAKELPTKRFHGDVDEDDSQLELGLGLGLGLSLGGGGGVKFLTAQDLPTSLGCHGAITGAKRAAAHQASSPPALSQVVGWPPVGSYRMNNLANQTRASNPEDEATNGECGNKKMNNGGESKAKAMENPHLGFVKVNMDGVQIGRKLDLNAHSSYESLAQAIEDMFFRPSSASINPISREKDQQGKSSKLLDGSSSEFVLTYEDKEGDWMLVGDVPFRMFRGTVKRLRIMRTSEANGLAPRSQERNDRVRCNKPI